MAKKVFVVAAMALLLVTGCKRWQHVTVWTVASAALIVLTWPESHPVDCVIGPNNPTCEITIGAR